MAFPLAIIPAVIGIIETVVGKTIKNKDQAEKLKSALTQQVLSLNEQELASATQILLAEIKGESWLQRNWRPMFMVWFGVLMGLHWFGFTPDNLSEVTINAMFTTINIGLGGYIVSRSGEKIVRDWKK